MKAFLGIIFFCTSILTLNAQRICGTVEYANKLMKADPAQADAYQQVEQQIAFTLKHQSALRDTTPLEIIHVPVVIHVLYNAAAQNISDAQIKSQIEALNKDFSNTNDDKVNTPAVFKPYATDTRIRFCLAQVDPSGKRTTGIIRKYTTNSVFFADDAMKSSSTGGDNAWDSKRYLNIWVCALSGRTLGYGTPPGGPVSLDGIVISYDVFGTVGNLRAPFNKGRTATHEIGHWLGLRHLWGDTECGDDGVDDTPRQKHYNYGCPTFPRVTTCSPNGNGDMFMNYMDYSDDGCMNMFTIGQKKRMRALFASNNLRNSFLNSYACDSNLVQAAPVAVNPVAAVQPVVVAPAPVKVYPNPTTGAITIDCKSATKTAPKTLAVFSVMGVKLMTVQLMQEKTVLNISGLQSGVYIIHVGEGKDAYYGKIVKQ